MKKVLILGSDYSTVRVALEAKSLGIYVIVADLMEKSPTKDVADEAWLISTTDIDLLEQKCRENNVSGIMFGASDFNINNARILCQRLNLPIYCDNDLTWNVARNKRLFKDICKKVGAPIADDYCLTDELNQEDIDKVVFPVVVKPCDKSGNRGMSYCENQHTQEQQNLINILRKKEKNYLFLLTIIKKYFLMRSQLGILFLMCY